MDQATECVYLYQPEFDISYPSVWPAGTVATEQAAILERCPGVNNQYGEVAEFDSPAGDIEIGE